MFRVSFLSLIGGIAAGFRFGCFLRLIRIAVIGKIVVADTRLMISGRYR